MQTFVSGGELFVRAADGALRRIDSAFAREKEAQAENRQNLNGWKTGNDDARNPYGNSQLIWGKQAMGGGFDAFRFKSVIPAGENAIYYVLANSFVTGLFHHDLESDRERRLFHRNDFIDQGMDFSPARKQFVAAIVRKDGQVDLELLDAEGNRLKTITGGDSFDAEPTFSRQDSNCVYFQSAGIARGNQGEIIALSPWSIQKLNLATGELAELCSDPDYDYLLPRQDADGHVYCIRRPHDDSRRMPWWHTPMNIVLFPFRFLSALLQFMKAFTALFGQQPRQTVGPNVTPPEGDRQVQVLGQVISLADVRRKTKRNAEPALVPKSWELVKLSADGREPMVLGTGVCGYDFDADGKIYITNGFRASQVADGKTTLVFKHDVIESFRVLAPSVKT